MAHFSERLEGLFEELESVEYDPVRGVPGLMGRLERVFWKIEQEGFPVMDDHRIGVLLRTLPRRAREVAHRIWGEFQCRLTYAELRRQLERHEFPEDLGESESESEDDDEDPEMDPEMEEDPEPEEAFEMEVDPEPEEVFEMEEDPESEGEPEEVSDDDVDIEIVDPDEDPEETVEDPDEIPEIPAPIVPAPLQDGLVMSLQLWMMFMFVWMYTLVGR